MKSKDSFIQGIKRNLSKNGTTYSYLMYPKTGNIFIGIKNISSYVLK
ncbi:hypothetical protein [Flavobacterium sp. ZB4P13]